MVKLLVPLCFWLMTSGARAETQACATPVACADACDRFDGFACLELGSMYEHGYGVDVDLAAASRMYQAACRSQLWEGCVRAVEPSKDFRPPLLQLLREACDGGGWRACISLEAKLVAIKDAGGAAQVSRALLPLAVGACQAGAPEGCFDAWAQKARLRVAGGTATQSDEADEVCRLVGGRGHPFCQHDDVYARVQGVTFSPPDQDNVWAFATVEFVNRSGSARTVKAWRLIWESGQAARWEPSFTIPTQGAILRRQIFFGEDNIGALGAHPFAARVELSSIL